MAKTLREIYNETIKALEYNKELLRKCENSEPPYDGIDENGKLIGGKNSKTWYAIFDTVINNQMMLDELVKTIGDRRDSIKYDNVVKYQLHGRCKECEHCSNIGNEVICKNPKMTIDNVSGNLSSNCLMKFDSFVHKYLKISREQTGCRYFKSCSGEVKIKI